MQGITCYAHQHLGDQILHCRDHSGDMNQKHSVQHEEELLRHSHFPLVLPGCKQFFRTGEIKMGSKMEHE